MNRTVPVLVACMLASCNIIPSRNPTSEPIVVITGTTLDGTRIDIPRDLSDANKPSSAPTILLIAYQRDAQFDADRWRLGLDELGVKCRVLLVHAIPSTFGVLLSPVLTHDLAQKFALSEHAMILPLTGESADRLATQTGMGRAQFAHVVVIAADGRIIYACDEGYCAERVQALTLMTASTNAQP